MTLTELQKIITDADPAAVLVSPRVLERVIQEMCDLRGVLWTVPHSQSYVVDRHVLFRFVEQDDLTLASHQLLPPTVILLSRPTPEELTAGDPGPLLLKYWRWLFHANLHLLLLDRWKQGLLSDQDIRQRLEQIGATETEEIRAVLRHDHCLPPQAAEQEVYIEFVALFLELHYFAPHLLPDYFPALRDLQAVAKLIRQDLDAEALWQRTRLKMAPEPGVKSDNNLYEEHEYYWKLLRGAEKAAAVGNEVKAAIARTRAARVAPAELSPGTRAAAEACLQRLTLRLKTPLELTEIQGEELLQELKKLLDKADQGHRPVEADFLYDLQKICIDHEKEIYALDVVEWLLSAGKRPIQRPLPSQRMVRIIRHLRSALSRLTLARLTEVDRRHLMQLLHTALHNAEERLRERFRPVLAAVLEDVGLIPRNPPEQTAFHKMIEEFLDRIAAVGFVTFGDLRDTISRNQLKMPDLTSPEVFIRGDALLRLDRRLANLLDGVYRPSEIYMRWLERLTALNFGTRIGRFLTRYVTLPFGAALLSVEAITVVAEHIHEYELTRVGFWSALVSLGVFYLALLHSRAFRRQCVRASLTAGHLLRGLLVDLPLGLAAMPPVQNLLASWPVQLTYWYLLKPGLLCALLWLLWPQAFDSWLFGVTLFLLAGLCVNSRTGQAFGETLLRYLLHLSHLLRAGVLGGLFHLIVSVFKKISDVVEWVLFSVDEWLRFRRGQSELALFLRTVLSLFWFPIAFVARFYFFVLIEPGINPLKVPIAFLAGKLLAPLMPGLVQLLGDQLSPFAGNVLAYTFATATVFLLPDAFGFLAWETKENWSLYRANRPKHLQAVPLGAHGETMRGLLKPGFHSGTVPKLYARLRQAGTRASSASNGRIIRSYRLALEEIEHALQRFVYREMISLLHLSTCWAMKPLSVAAVRLASNRIDVELRHSGYPEQSVWLQFEYRSGWLVAGLRQTGWLAHLSPEASRCFLAALTFLYKLAGVDLVEEQLRGAFPQDRDSYEITPQGLTVWLDGCTGKAVCYDFRNANGQLLPQQSDGGLTAEGPALATHALIFARAKVSWEQLVRIWQDDSKGLGDTPLQPELYACQNGFEITGSLPPLDREPPEPLAGLTVPEPVPPVAAEGGLR